jgi:hypothetical protein
MTQQELIAKIQKLDDIETIKQLMHNYTYWLDYGEFDKALNCFAEDAVLDVREREAPREGHQPFEVRCSGMVELRNFYSAIVHKRDKFSASHLLLNPVVNVEGDLATGIFYLLEPTAIQRAIWGHGRYDLKFSKIEGEWKIKMLAFEWNFNTPYDEGWFKTPMVFL